MTKSSGHHFGLQDVINDLQKEHTRWQDRLKATDRLVEACDKTSPKGRGEEGRYLAQKAYLEAKLEYVELLIRRYRSWL